MQTVTFEATWRRSITVEVPDDFDLRGDFSTLDKVPEYILEQVDSNGAELVDWDIRR